MLDSPTPFQRLLERLKNPALYDPPSGTVTLLETHISAVLLAGDYAYKLKKPYNLGFLDFSTLAARRHFCEAELRLNRRLAPDLYLGVIPITGSIDTPRFGGEGQAIEYAVKMRRFPQEALLSNVLLRNALQAGQLDVLAQRIAAFHDTLPGATPAQPHGTPDSIHAAACQNFSQIEPLLSAPEDRAQLVRLAQIADTLFAATAPIFLQRKHAGFVRECHGDLHLGNMVLIHGEIVPFDCIEFNDDFRWIDVMSEIAFVVMDLTSRGHPDFGFRFLNTYLEHTGDFAGLKVLRYYLMYRAVVRAKIAAFRATASETPPDSRIQAWQAYRHYMVLTEQFSRIPPPLLILMHGVSGSGKSTVARDMAAHLPAIHVRSDVERKRLFGLAPLARSHSAPGTGIYSAEATQRTYARLAEIARGTLAAGYAVVLDATFLGARQRAFFQTLSNNTWIVSCDAPVAILRARVTARYQAGTDAAEANLAILEQQLASRETLTAAETQHAIFIDTARPFDPRTVAAQLRRSLS